MNSNSQPSGSDANATSDRQESLEAMDQQLTEDIQLDQEIQPDAGAVAQDYEQDSTHSDESSSRKS
jgi:hypothetical protein